MSEGLSNADTRAIVRLLGEVAGIEEGIIKFRNGDGGMNCAAAGKTSMTQHEGELKGTPWQS